MAKAVPFPLPALGAQLPEEAVRCHSQALRGLVQPPHSDCPKSITNTSPAKRSNLHIACYRTFLLSVKKRMMLISLQPRLPVPTEFIKPCCDFLLLLLLLHLPPPSPRQKTSGKPAISLFQGWLFITALLPFIFAPVCLPACAPPVSSLIFTVCWGGKCFSIYWHIYLMCFAAHGVIKQRLSPSKQCKLHLTPNFPCRPSTSSVTRSMHKAICNHTDVWHGDLWMYFLAPSLTFLSPLCPVSWLSQPHNNRCSPCSVLPDCSWLWQLWRCMEKGRGRQHRQPLSRPSNCRDAQSLPLRGGSTGKTHISSKLQLFP